MLKTLRIRFRVDPKIHLRHLGVSQSLRRFSGNSLHGDDVLLKHPMPTKGNRSFVGIDAGLNMVKQSEETSPYNFLQPQIGIVFWQNVFEVIDDGFGFCKGTNASGT
jgi:hypothetical protein